MLIEVQTTQNVTIDYEPAGIGNRLAAALIDYAIFAIWIISWIFIFGYFIPGGIYNLLEKLDYTAIIFLSIIVIGPITFYNLLFEYFNHGQSIGKMIMKIRVVRVDGTRPSFGSLLLRWLFRPIDIDLTASFGIPGLVGLISIISTKKSQRVGDIVAGTTVVGLKPDKKSIKLRDINLDFADNYVVTYADILNRLSDKDVQTIMSIMDDNNLKDGDAIRSRLSARIKFLTGYTYDGFDTNFLQTVINDYNYLSLQ